MFISQKSYDRVNARNIKLVRQIKDLNEESKYLHEENKDLRYENEELRDIIKNIKKSAEGNTYNNDKAVLGKIKELIRDYQGTN